MTFRYLIIPFIIGGVQACDSDEYIDPTHRCSWYIKNVTGDSLLIKDCSFNYFAQPLILPNDTSKSINSVAIVRYEKGDLFNGIDNYNVIDDSVVISNMKGEILIVWKESQNREDGKQFFNERYWKKREWEEGKYLYHEWTFELLPEDIQN